MAERLKMNRILSVVATANTIAVAVALSTGLAEWSKKEIVGLTPDDVGSFTPITTAMAGSEHNCSVTPAKTVPGSIE